MKEKKSKNSLIISLVIYVALIAYFFIKHADSALSWAVALLGFGLIIFIHELGHFLVARKCDIDCEAFSIGMAIGTPYLFSFKKMTGTLLVRILPKTSGLRENIADDCLFVLTIPAPFKSDGDTEYCLGPLPVGGFVKMKGQDDSGAVDVAADTDPRSFVNKSIGQRMAVVSAGVIFNVIGAFLIFAILARIGVDKVPAQAGWVENGSPAQVAGIEAGDKIIAINGKSMKVGGRSNLDFSHIMLAAILSGEEPVSMELEKNDGTITDIELSPIAIGGSKVFGISKPKVMKVAEFDGAEAENYYKRTGFRPGDEIYAMDSEPLSGYPEFRNKLNDVLAGSVFFSAKRLTENADEFEVISSRFEVLYPVTAGGAFTGERKPANICSLLPPLKIAGGRSVFNPAFDDPEKRAECSFIAGDVIAKVGEVDWPTFDELNEVVSANGEKPLELVVLRSEQGAKLRKTISVTPKPMNKNAEPKLGIYPVLDLATPVVSGMLHADGTEPLIRKGEVIKQVNGVNVADFYEIARAVQQAAGEKIVFTVYPAEKLGGTVQGVTVDLPAQGERVCLNRELADSEPFDDYKISFQADNVFHAVQLSSFWVGDMLGQSVSTIKGLFERKIGADMLSGPIGIARLSHKIAARHDFAFFLYFMGMISCFLAVMNFLPIPIVDGGVFLLLIVEKIKGSPVSVKVQKVLIYAGLAFIVALFALVIFNDVMNIIRGN
jgi:regulator of sigma E protease